MESLRKDTLLDRLISWYVLGEKNKKRPHTAATKKETADIGFHIFLSDFTSGILSMTRYILRSLLHWGQTTSALWKSGMPGFPHTGHLILSIVNYFPILSDLPVVGKLILPIRFSFAERMSLALCTFPSFKAAIN